MMDLELLVPQEKHTHGIRAICRPHVEDVAASLEEGLPTVEELWSRFHANLATDPRIIYRKNG